MSTSPALSLYATRDFTTFQFSDRKSDDPFIWRVRFIRQSDNRTYEATLSCRTENGGSLSIRSPDPSDDVLATFLLIIDVYTDRYPARIIRLQAESVEQARKCRQAVEKHLKKLEPLFIIGLDKEVVVLNFDLGMHESPLVLKRKPIPFITLTSITTVWNVRSRLFNEQVAVVMDQSIQMKMATPTDDSGFSNH
jgi:hypothetical protein